MRASYTRERQLPAGRRNAGLETRDCVCCANYEYLFIDAYVISRGSRRRRRRRLSSSSVLLCVLAVTGRANKLSLSIDPELRTASPSVVLNCSAGGVQSAAALRLSHNNRDRICELTRERERATGCATEQTFRRASYRPGRRGRWRAALISWLFVCLVHASNFTCADHRFVSEDKPLLRVVQLTLVTEP